MNPILKLITVSLALFASFIFMTGQISAAEPEAAEEKVYTIYVKGAGTETGIVLKQLAREDFHGVPCFSGIGIVDYTKGVRIRIPIESVSMVMEFESEEALDELAKQFDQRRKQEGEEGGSVQPDPRPDSD